MKTYMCIHGHFYQPPRENPWTEHVDVQESAFPYRDWNERIAVECYAPNLAARILDGEGGVQERVNNYSKMSFNFGPTLLSWLERRRPDIYGAILQADRMSIRQFAGHGAALAQVYNHMIMPLASNRDKYTQAYWGIRDFQHRFGRKPAGMWLPETAVDTETLEVLVQLGIRFTVLAPRQAGKVRNLSHSGEWHDVTAERINPTTAYLCRLPSGGEINLFFYDGAISSEIAFGDLLENGDSLEQALLQASPKGEAPSLVHVATDGETFGHHHRFGEMALARCLDLLESDSVADLTNYAKYLEDHPPIHTAQIVEGSSWSCDHGVGRWSSHCGCNQGSNPGWTQAWRGPLREAMDQMRDRLLPFYEEEAGKYLSEPWSARNDYIDVVLDRSAQSLETFFVQHSCRALSVGDKTSVLRLLEVQRNALLAYTSCGWFFDEISGIETIQVMRYASRALQLAADWLGAAPESEYIALLQQAPSNAYRDGADVYSRFVEPARIDGWRVGLLADLAGYLERP